MRQVKRDTRLILNRFQTERSEAAPTEEKEIHLSSRHGNR